MARSIAPVVLRIILAIVLAVPGFIGLGLHAWLLWEWSANGYQFQSGDLWIMPVFIIGALGCVSFSVLTIGIVLRFARWAQAPVVSLVLSILSAVVLVLGYQMLLACFSAEDPEDRMASLAGSAIGLIVISGPPLLHWWNVTKTGQSPPH